MAKRHEIIEGIRRSAIRDRNDVVDLGRLGDKTFLLAPLT